MGSWPSYRSTRSANDEHTRKHRLSEKAGHHNAAAAAAAAAAAQRDNSTAHGSEPRDAHAGDKVLLARTRVR